MCNNIGKYINRAGYDDYRYTGSQYAKALFSCCRVGGLLWMTPCLKILLINDRSFQLGKYKDNVYPGNDHPQYQFRKVINLLKKADYFNETIHYHNIATTNIYRQVN